MRDRLWYAGPLIVIGIAALAAVLAVAASGSPTASDARTKTLSLAVAGTDADYTDPALSYSGLGWQIEYVTCSKLVNYSDVRGSELSPDAATSLPVVSNNGKTYTFTIKSGIRFDDGAARDRQQLRGGVQPGREPGHAVAGQLLHGRRGRLQRTSSTRRPRPSAA